MSEKHKILFIDDDKDSADEYLEDAQSYLLDATVIYEVPPQDISSVVDLVQKHNAFAVEVDERLRQRSEANYLGIDVLNFLNNAMPDLPVVILTEYERDSDLRKVPGQQLFRKYNLLTDEGKKYHFDILMDFVNQYQNKQNKILEHKKIISEIKEINEINIREIAHLHFLIDDSVEAVIWFPNSQRKEVQLIEVNRTALSTNSVEPFLIQASDEIGFPLLVADITPREWEKIQNGTIRLPNGWELSNSKMFERIQIIGDI